MTGGTSLGQAARMAQQQQMHQQQMQLHAAQNVADGPVDAVAGEQ